MAIPTQFGEIASSVIGKIISGSIMVVGTLLLIVILAGALFFIFYLRKFNVKVRFKTKRGTGADGKPIYKIYYDKGGILTNKRDKRSFFRILRERVDLPCPPYEAFQISSKGGNEVEIIQESDSEYYYSIPGAIENKKFLSSNENGTTGTVNQNMRVVESDVSYWNQLRRRETRRMFDPEGLLWKIAPIALAVFMIMGVVFYTYIWLDKAPAIVEAARAVSEELKVTAQVLQEITMAKTAGG